MFWAAEWGKTKICRNWKSGECKYRNCMFAHGEAERKVSLRKRGAYDEFQNPPPLCRTL